MYGHFLGCREYAEGDEQLSFLGIPQQSSRSEEAQALLKKYYDEYVEALADKLQIVIEDTRNDIFDDIETLGLMGGGLIITIEEYNELKKKYTEESDGNIN